MIKDDLKFETKGYMRAARDYLLRRFYGGLPRTSRPRGRPGVREDDYMAVPIPVNVPVPLAYNCLVWLWGLGSGGYGVLSDDNRRKGAHRAAYEQANSVELPPDIMVLHLCHRPFCIQPAHLYQGGASQNAQDREAWKGKMNPDILGPMPPGGLAEVARTARRTGTRFFEYLGDRFDRSANSAAVGWPDPRAVAQQLTLECPTPAECPEHIYRIPAGQATLCIICGGSDSGFDTRLERLIQAKEAT